MTTLSDIKNKGWNALVKSLGISDDVMFVMEHEPGSGDYTKERKRPLKTRPLLTLLDELSPVENNFYLVCTLKKVRSFEPF